MKRYEDKKLEEKLEEGRPIFDQHDLRLFLRKNKGMKCRAFMESGNNISIVVGKLMPENNSTKFMVKDNKFNILEYNEGIPQNIDISDRRADFISNKVVYVLEIQGKGRKNPPQSY